MTLAISTNFKNQEKTLGHYAYSAIEKHFKKSLKWETTVKKDKDPEALHQMRVGLRRLRTDVNRFSVAVDLPKSVSDKNIGKIARCLGNLRDFDVFKETLETLYRPHLSGKEEKSLQTALNALDKQRENALEDVRSTLKHDPYKSVKHQLKNWLEEPRYQSIASFPIEQVIPDLLLPEISSFLLHRGWLIGTESEHSEIVIPAHCEAQNIQQLLTTEGEVLHSLRKQAKRLRYQMELFTDLYGESYKAFIAQVENVQEILGAINDRVVLSELLTNLLNSEIHHQLPTLACLFTENIYQLWQQWQSLQKWYLKPQTRHEFHLTVMHPVEGARL
ncbi:CHAD domain-containing protein [Aetokthonos hydrillicola Thurmond2011]|jgi:CHAD domain-containing protein|uniref:CHAD domain-containing protein n=1 Tax=Aetokthonos hydrillicola Thurmond2011 TaxID=2712845 RepID=A0AAP5I5F7_9CYAN|nr:CHAD domain-containing protein [Aetokthonos hydrillicola]MBO3457286.1 CHAD domain-containing protein [Aetokthonos hydrillicola CCALA 1050]MBW4586631.1 CHAD domain-containing protein [Aetokthonos hydrillicola CCALA 1050]MDR9894042.1 CHAD domain-containing protein [Aetokthonos hydrillicola Thurmond2011]